MNQFILAYDSIAYQGTIDLSYSLYNPPHMEECILSPILSIFSDHFKTKMVYISPYVYLYVVISSFEVKPSICEDYFYPPHRRKNYSFCSLLEKNTHPDPYQAAPDLVIRLSLGFIASTTSQLILINTDLLKIPLQHNIRVNNINSSLMNQLCLRFQLC